MRLLGPKSESFDTVGVAGIFTLGAVPNLAVYLFGPSWPISKPIRAPCLPCHKPGGNVLNVILNGEKDTNAKHVFV